MATEIPAAEMLTGQPVFRRARPGALTDWRSVPVVVMPVVMPHVVMPVVRVGGRGGGGGRDNPKGGQGKQEFLHDRFLVSSVPVGVRTPHLNTSEMKAE
jgi:hypothetical protein